MRVPQWTEEGPAPASFAQERLWLVDQLGEHDHAYNVYHVLRVAGPLDIPRLRAALDGLVARHESLRTTFRPGPTHPVQVVGEPASAELTETRTSDVDSAVHAACHRPFDLAAGPLFRAELVLSDDGDPVLVLAMHHIVTDGWSTRILAADLAALYAGEQLAAPPVRYRDFAAWQRERLSGTAFAAELDHWRTALAGQSPVLQLPTDRPRPPVPRHDGAAVRATLPADEVRLLANRCGVSVFALLLTAVRVLLRAHSGQDRFVLASSMAGRDLPELEDVVGFFVNTLALGGDLSGAPSFAEAAAREQETVLTAFDHAAMPFEALVRELVTDRDPTRAPLAQVFVQLDRGDAEGWRLPGLDVTQVRLPLDAAKFDLSFFFSDHGHEIAVTLAYATALYERPTARLLVRRLAELLRSALSTPDASVDELSLLPAEERRTLLEDWNDTTVPYPAGTCLHQLVEDQAARTPAAVAVRAAGRQLSYEDLEARANRLAHRLRRVGVGPEVVVGVHLHRGIDLVVALLAVLKAGGAYLPVDPEYPASRQAFLLSDSSARVVITSTGPPDGYDGEVVHVDGDLRGEPEHAPASGVRADNAAYVLYTSGSTGRPKGVVIEHRGVVNRLRWAQDTYRLDATDRVLQKTPYSFDVSVWELFWPLIAGATLVMARPGGHREPDYLDAVMAAERITTVHFVPSMLRVFLAEEPVRLPALRRVLCSGEALPADLVDTARELLGCQLHNLYGPTEASIDVTAAPCDPGWPVTIGTPIANTRAYVVDRELRPVPIGVPGELCLAGVQLARGYLNRPATTAAAFVPDPFGEPGTRLYRTGDLVRHRPDGEIEFLGRLDDQVKVRGHRIEPGEIEARLLEHPSVAAATVMARGDVDVRLVGYVVPAPGAEPLRDVALREFCRRTLPSVMVPDEFVVLPEFPLTANGKLDHAALPDPAARQETGHVPARDTTEKEIARIWTEVLRTGDEPGVHDDFFGLGGHSLLAIKAMVEVRRRFAVELPSGAIFTARTVAELATAVDAAVVERLLLGDAPDEHGGDTGPVPRGADAGPAPLAMAQRGLWITGRLTPDTAEYLVPVALRIEGPLDVAALRAALTASVHRHEALRTRIVEQDGEPVQVVDPPGEADLTVVALGSTAEVEPFLRTHTRTPMDLADGPACQAVLAHVADTDHVLVVRLHHILADGWSVAVLADELAHHYAVATGEVRPPLPELPVRYADFAVWQRTRAHRVDEDLAHWRRQLAGMPHVLDLPADRARPAVRDTTGDHLEFSVPAEVTRAIAAFGQARGATLFMVLLAGFQAIVGRYTGLRDFGVGTPVPGREHPTVQGVVGHFVNTVVLRADLSGDPDLGELVDRVRRATTAAFDHQEAPFDRVVEELCPRRDPSRNPLVQLMFTFDEGSAERWSLPGLLVTELPAHTHTSKFDLSMAMRHDEAGGLSCAVEYPVALFDAATVERLTGQYVLLLARLAAAPELPVGAHELVTEADTRWLRETVNDTAVEPGEWSVPALVAEQAAIRPGAVAVAYGQDRLTYAQLDRRANQFAHFLRGRGVGREDRVAVCLDRGGAVAVAYLGVLKAGGCVVPVDPAYPAERIAFMLGDAAARVVVAQRDLVGALRWDELQPGLDVLPTTPPAGVVDPDALACLMYTSGSTGRPKGVQVTHRGIVRLVRGGLVDAGPGEVFLLLTPLSFDPSLFEMWGALCTGATLAVHPPGLPTADGLREVVLRHGVTTAHLPAELFHVLVEERPDAFAGVRTLLVGGDVLSPVHVRAVLDAGDVAVSNWYGPTECTVVTSAHRVVAGTAGRVPIGRPVANTRVYVVDESFRLAPVGVPGELVVAGSGLARGYHGRPGLTAERFVPSPFEPGERVYRTGDLVRLRADGVLDFLGRLDDQVKIRGFRVEPGEVEARLATHPAVRRALVTVRDDARVGRRLVAYLTGAALPPHEELRLFCRRWLPDHMVPDAFVALASFPLDHNGKVNRAALPPPSGAGGDADRVRPSTPVQLAVAAIWAEVLGVPEPGVHDDFFDLGGQSLLAIRVQSRLRAVFAVDLPMHVLFEATTIAALADVVRAAIEAELDALSERELLDSLGEEAL